MNNVIHFDTETIPSQEEWVRPYFAKNVKPPKTLKKQSSIDEWRETKKESAIDDACAKAGFSGASNHICCISWAIDMVGAPDQETKSAFISNDVSLEKEIIKNFFADISKVRYPVFAGHNIIGFDIRVIKQRAMVLGVPIPQNFPVDAKPWDKTVYDTMLKWDARDFIKMDLIATAFGLDGKGSVDGSMVYPMWKEGRHKEIAKYCEDDVRMGREVYNKMTFKS